MTYEEKKLTDNLRRWHRGKHNAIHHRDLAKQMKMNPRSLRQLLNHLVVSHKVPIGSTSSAGIFYIKDFSEWEHCNRELKSREIEIRNRRLALQQAASAGLDAQQPLFDTEGTR